ncbi:MAG: type IX secretion system outer membrane channel protein PorV [Saprospiraceae bacterium]|nr:type IX secretion system outer membrane channel protein PorV [Saprospiraceae bacterium]MCB0543122.1 type IX secretion system outer membrane channel protein PorV [Saprospiraceae bacterium]MCB0576396.1 type IX secretion system outer membrane channel protein PorV [Saprospiraceae bacterium]MCB9306642.1 type IX secretion system outer membrane channel protein PorV [Lewinellaceae bacterium]MCB9355221.1 type IX secretion system outer membrane channel protein PorV [Lewinellaceae bacterium]
MKKLFALSLIAAGLFCGTPALKAQIEPKCKDGYNPITGERCANAVTSAVPFLRIVPDARGGAMGDAGIATSADPNAMHYNPSKLAFVDKRVSISATYTPWMRNLGLQDVYLAYLSGYVRLDKLQAVGFGLRYFSLGDIEFTDEQGMSLGQGRPNEFEITGGYARKLSDRFSAAIGAKFIYSNLATGRVVEGNEIKPGIAGAADFSMTYKAPVTFTKNKSEFTLGVAVSNLGSKITYTNSINRDYIPTNLGLGLAWKFNLDEFNTLTFTSDFNKLLVPTPRPEIDEDGDKIPDYKQYSSIRGVFKSFGDAPGGFSEELKEITIGGGAEYWYDDQFAVRAGYFYEHYSKGNRKYFSVGLGVKYNIFGLNFSYLVPTTNQRNPLDNTLRFSLLFDFDAFDSETN